MTVDPRDLCQVADCKALMGKSGQNANTQDALIQTLITRASIKIMRDYGREFVPGGTEGLSAVSASRVFEYESDVIGETFIDLNPYDLQLTPVPTVVMDPDLASSITLTPAQFRLWPASASKGVYEAIRLSLYTARSAYPRFNHRQVSLTGNWGFPSVPFEVEQACAETVIHWITSYPGARRVDQVDSGIPAMTPRSYPMSAIDLLCNFKRVVV